MRSDRRETTPSAAMSRRAALGTLASGALAALATRAAADEREEEDAFRLRYALATSMYGTTSLAEILPEVAKTGAESLDIWPRPHGDQREQVDAMGHERFRELLQEHGVRLGIITQYRLGPFGLGPELPIAKKLGAKLLITGSRGPKDLEGAALRDACKDFARKMEPHVAAAEELGLSIAIENHGGSLIRSPDSMRWLVEHVRSKSLGIALAPYHLPQEPASIAKLIDDLGPRILDFYAWQHGKGSTKKLPKEEELLQMPGRGALDFGPIVAALRRTGYAGWTQIFMHPVPRGVPILETTAAVTAEIDRARRYLERLARTKGGSK